MTIRNVGINTFNGRDEKQELTQTLEATGASDYIRLTGDLVVHLSGTATSVVATVERSTSDPAGTANWAPAEDETFTGDLTSGLSPRSYIEPMAGYWRVNVTTLTGGNVTVSISGVETK